MSNYKANNDGLEVFVDTNNVLAEIVGVSFIDYEGNEEFDVMDWQGIWDNFMLIPEDFVPVL